MDKINTPIEKAPGTEVEENVCPVNSVTHQPDGEEQVPHIHAKTIILVLSVYFVYVACGFNITAAGAFGPNVGAALGGEAQSTWLVIVLVIIIAVLSPPVMQGADLWGRKWFLVCMTALGMIGCLVVATANSMTVAIVGQVLTGIGASTQPLVHAITSEVTPRRYRAIAQGGLNIAVTCAAVVVLPLGGVLTRGSVQHGFRTLFYINAGLFALATIGALLLYNPPLRETQKMYTQREKLAKVDWIGLALILGGLTPFCVALTWSQNPYPWTNAHIIAPFAVGLVMVIGLLVYETWVKKDGMFHHRLFNRNFSLALFCVFVEGLVYFSINNYFAFEIATVYEHNPVIFGVRLSTPYYYSQISTGLTGLYCTRTKTLRYPIVFGFSLFTIFMILMSTTQTGSNVAVWCYPILFGTGLGILLNTLMTLAQLGTPPELIAPASGLIISIRSVGGTIGLAIYNAIFTHKLSTNITKKIPAAVIPLGLPPSSLGPLIGDLTSGHTAAASQIPGATPAIIDAGANALMESFVNGFRFVWITAGCFALVATIVAFFFRDPREEFNTRIDAPVESEESLYKESHTFQA